MRLMEDERMLLHRGRKAGREEGLKEGKTCTLISMVWKKLQKNKTIDTIAEELEEEISVIEPIYKAVQESGENYDCVQIYEKLTGRKIE